MAQKYVVMETPTGLEYLFVFNPVLDHAAVAKALENASSVSGLPIMKVTSAGTYHAGHPPYCVPTSSTLDVVWTKAQQDHDNWVLQMQAQL